MDLCRRISASPRPCNGRRILARKRPRVETFVNSVNKLQKREISSKRSCSFSLINDHEKFRHIRLEVSELYSQKYLFLIVVCFEYPRYWGLLIRFMEKRLFLLRFYYDHQLRVLKIFPHFFFFFSLLEYFSCSFI